MFTAAVVECLTGLILVVLGIAAYWLIRGRGQEAG